MTGGINLNVCALITNVAAGNWLAHDGILAFLMPDSLLVQSTYRGFRELRTAEGGSLSFKELHDWSAGGKPFAPVGQNFYVYFLGADEGGDGIVPVRRYIKKPNNRKAEPSVGPLSDYRRATDFGDISHVFNVEAAVAFPARGNARDGYLIQAEGTAAMPEGIAGEAAYISRQGIEFLPKTVFMLRYGKSAKRGQATFSTFGNAADQHVLETEFMFPMIQGSRIGRFSPPEPSFYAPFPYDEGQRSPISSRPVKSNHSLARRAPKLAEYLDGAAVAIGKQSDHNLKISGKHGTEFYSLARVGAYTYAEHFVAFRDNTAWAACVVSGLDTPWGERKRPLFQKHAVTVSQRPDGSFISLDEAHYLCAILNSTSVEQFVMSSNDKRSFKIRLPVRTPVFDPDNEVHIKLASISRKAHSAVVKAGSGSAAAAADLAAMEADVLYRELLHGL